MTLFLTLLVAVGLYLILLVTAWGVGKKDKKKERSCEDISGIHVTKEEYYKVMNFMVLYGIISYDQYLEIESKSLMYVND